MLTSERENKKRKMYAVSYQSLFIAGCYITYISTDNIRTIPNKRSFISYVAVKVNFRGQGIGTFMLNSLFEKAKYIVCFG